mmetsp:Transcript_9137/g.33730  ORF Transcript_9137/g.33730 Transcript_9137/m.33730 type:complete len:777 (+) Transcript_9137:796-3126(+)|eukprot:CAMPEP_0117450546 /NCGR_PEP_ID=MMETSP0759-20121206/8526_1 /TAXON_ID=63605 /ORGANISM="Percolomonas cosmopolitus, Strain WS" /LENGTH=776 /DNA_ID=CAMNT_0005243075 /DNA_START=748 /DNA_END=3078 /DNA_ORIENTATION=+
MESWDDPPIGDLDPFTPADVNHDTADPSPHHRAKKQMVPSSPMSSTSEKSNKSNKGRRTRARAGVSNNANISPMKRSSTRRANQMPLDDDTEHFRQYVSTQKHPTGAAFLRRRTLQQKYLSPVNRVQQAAHVAANSQNASSRLAPQGFVAGMHPGSQSPSHAQTVASSNPYGASQHKPEWNNRVATHEQKIPSYNASKDKYLKRHRRTMRKKNKLTSAYKTTPPPNRGVLNGRRSIRSNNSTHSPTALAHGRRVKNAWVGPSKENLGPNARSHGLSPSPSNFATSEAQKTIKQLQFKLDENSRLLETRENDLKQVRHEKSTKDRLVEKIKDRYRKLKEHGTALKEENERLQDKMKRLSTSLKARKKAPSSTSSLSSTGGGSAPSSKQSLKDTLNKHRQQVSQLQNELNMFKMQNQMLRDQEKVAREGNQHQGDYVEEITRLRKQLRIEKERVRKLKERVEDKEKSSQRVDKLRNYLEREKKDASKTQALNNKLQQQFDEMQQQYNSSLSKIEDMDREKRELALKLQQLKEVILGQKQRIENLETDNIDLGQKIINMEKNTSGVAKAKNMVQQQVKEKEEDLKRVARRVSQLEKEKSDVEQQYSNLRNEFETMKNKYQQMETKMRALKSTQQSVSATSAENNKLQTENDRLRKDLNTRDQELKQLMDSQTSKIETERFSKQQTEKELDSVHKELRQLREEVKSLRIDQSRKEQMISAIQSEKSSLEQKLDRAQVSTAEVEDLKKKLQEVTDRCSVLSESNSLLLLRLKREEAKREKK